MATQIQFVTVPSELKRIVGKQEKGARMYRYSGPEAEAPYWTDALFDVFGKMVSPGGVCMFAPVSRAAVHKRMKDGNLTAFLFYAETDRKNFFGSVKRKRELDYIWIPVSECWEWKREIEERAKRLGRVTREELEGEIPDWHGEFLQWKNKKERIGYLDRLKMDGITISDDIKAKIMVRLKGEYTRKPKQGKMK